MSVNAVRMMTPEEQRRQAEAFVNLPDRDLRNLAYMTAPKKKSNALDKALWSLPVVTATASALLHKGSLSSKMLVGAMSGGSWVVPLLLLKAFDGLTKKLNKSSEKVRNFNEKNPVISAIANIGVFFAALAGANKGVGKLGQMLTKKFPQLGVKIADKLKVLVSKIDGGKLNTKVLPAITSNLSRLTQKFPAVKSVANFVLRNAHWGVLLGGFVKSASDSNKQSGVALSNYIQLKDAQVETAKNLRA